MKFGFFRRSDDGINESLVDIEALTGMDTEEITVIPEPLPDSPTVTDEQAICKAVYGRIGVVSLDENHPNLPVLFAPDADMESPLLEKIILPRNPRMAVNEFYQLEAVDMVLLLNAEGNRIDRYTLRWMKRLQQMGLPLVLLLSMPLTEPTQEDRIEQFSRQMGVPVIPVDAENLTDARQELVLKTLHIAPAMALALAGHLPAFRSSLIDELLQRATTESLINNADTLMNRQMQLLQQISAACGHTEKLSTEETTGLRSLLTAAHVWAEKLVRYMPLRDARRRERFVSALSTLFAGYAAAVYHGAPAPSLRNDLLPKVWRLYRASRQSIQA